MGKVRCQLFYNADLFSIYLFVVHLFSLRFRNRDRQLPTMYTYTYLGSTLSDKENACKAQFIKFGQCKKMKEFSSLILL